MADYAEDGRQEYIPAGRLGKQPLQRPLSAHHSHIRNPAPAGKQPAFGASAPHNNGRRIQSALPYRNRPGTAGAVPHAALNAWGEPSAPAAVGSPRAYGGGGGGLNLFAGMEPPAYPQRSENTRPIASREREALDEELRRLRVTLAGYKDQHRLLRTDRQRLEEELGRARTNLVKAEELLNAREKALSPTIGLSQMYRTPETTALVTKLKEQVRVLRAEKERFKGDLEELLRSTKATRVAELQSEAHALSQELARQMEMTAIMRNRMEDAEAMAAAAQRKAEAAEALARDGRVRKTMGALQQAHRALSSQATLLRAMFPPGLSMEQLAAKASLKAPTAGATEVLRFLRHHVSNFMGQPDLEADVEQLADVSALLIAEHKRLTGAVGSHVFADGEDGEEQDVSSRENPLYQPVPKADPDLVPDEEEEGEGGKKKALAEEETYEDDFAADGYEERSNRSVQSNRSAPDTPQKKVEAPASSVGDPAEYGTGVRTSAAGSAYGGSTRGWQPEEEPVKEHHSEAGSDEDGDNTVASKGAKSDKSGKRSTQHSGEKPWWEQPYPEPVAAEEEPAAAAAADDALDGEVDYGAADEPEREPEAQPASKPADDEFEVDGGMDGLEGDIDMEAEAAPAVAEQAEDKPAAEEEPAPPPAWNRPQALPPLGGRFGSSAPADDGF
eukprot:XP_001694550.1 flagellar associated protein [Chlamydomonas reinhardtii]